MTKRSIELREDGGTFAIVRTGVDGFGQIHISLLREILDRAGIEFEETVL